MNKCHKCQKMSQNECRFLNIRDSNIFFMSESFFCSCDRSCFTRDLGKCMSLNISAQGHLRMALTAAIMKLMYTR